MNMSNNPTLSPIFATLMLKLLTKSASNQKIKKKQVKNQKS